MLLSAVMILAQTGCSLLDQQPADQVRARARGQDFFRSDANMKSIAARYADYAVMSELVYPESDRDQPVCNRDTIPATLDRRYGGRLFGEAGQRFEATWEPACDVVRSINAYELAHPGHGLRLDVWLRKSLGSDVCDEAVIVFRGTLSLSDWVTDFRWLRTGLRFLKQVLPEDRYDRLNRDFDIFLEQVKLKHCATITATGHSLGGGLAQMAARLSKRTITRVYAFNPSDATGDDLTRDKDVSGLLIERIYERGEALTYTRRVVEDVNSRVGGLTCVPFMIDVRFSFDEPVWAASRHAMKALAYDLVVAAGGVGAAPAPGNALHVLKGPQPHCEDVKGTSASKLP